jgi:hypothetical protein
VDVENSSSDNSLKIHLAGMPYKRFSQAGWRFSITGFEAVCAENEFFNTHRPSHSSSAVSVTNIALVLKNAAVSRGWGPIRIPGRWPTADWRNLLETKTPFGNLDDP